MPQDQEKYQYFQVGLLKDSHALEALWKDAVKHHMIDQPSQLIAIRLTEYYELLERGLITPATRAAAAPTSAPVRHEREQGFGGANPPTTPAPREANPHQTHTYEPTVVKTSPDVAQNADDAADYWALL